MVDSRRRLRAAAFMEIAQELAGQGAEQLKMADRDLKPINAVWVLARMHVDFVKTPVRDTETVLQTWHKGLQGIQYIRDYAMNGQDGQPLVLATSSWLIMELDERRLLHGDVLNDYIPSEPQCSDNAVSEAPRKITIPRGLSSEHAGVHAVRYSDVDYNGHANNTKYIVWALDVLPERLVYDCRLAGLDINYNKESHAGETVSLLRYDAGGTQYVEGRCEDGQQCFVCRFVFEE